MNKKRNVEVFVGAMNKLKYREKLEVKRLIMIAVYILVIFTLAVGAIVNYEPIDDSPVHWRMEISTISRRVKPIEKRKAIAADAFAKFSNFRGASNEEKLKHWEKDYFYRRNSHNKELREKLVDIILKFAPHGSVVLDAGAHVGDTGGIMLETLRAVGRKDIHMVAVDPDLSKCQWMTRLREDFVHQYDDLGFRTNFHIVNSGIWSHKSRANVFRKNHGGAWTIEEDPWAGEVELSGLSDIIKSEANLFMWHLDVEGTEINAINGMLKTKHRPIMIVEALPGVGEDILAPINKLKSVGYRTVDRLPPNRDYLMFPPSMYNVTWTY